MRIRSVMRSWGAVLVAAGALAGCAPAAGVSLRVNRSALGKVPDQVRETITKEEETLARAREEARRAEEERLATARELAAMPGERRAGDEGLARLRARLAGLQGGKPEEVEEARLAVSVAEAELVVLGAKQAWLEARVRWRERISQAARLRVDAQDANLEQKLAQVAAYYDSSVELDRYRGQHARLHQRASEAQAQVKPARQEVDRREGELMGAKARYATLRGIPATAPATMMADPAPPAPAPPPPPRPRK